MRINFQNVVPTQKISENNNVSADLHTIPRDVNVFINK
jgi:hypothetical protein